MDIFDHIMFVAAFSLKSSHQYEYKLYTTNLDKKHDVWDEYYKPISEAILETHLEDISDFLRTL